MHFIQDDQHWARDQVQDCQRRKGDQVGEHEFFVSKDVVLDEHLAVLSDSVERHGQDQGDRKVTYHIINKCIVETNIA